MVKDFGEAQKQVRDSSKPEQLDQSSAPSLNILIAEDDTLSQRLLELMLKSTGHAMKFVSNGVDAVQIVKSEEVDLVLMDIQMPLMDGLEATRQIRKWENGKKHLPVVGLTAIIASVYGKCMQAGMDDIVTKPFDIKHLQKVLNACIDQKVTTAKKTVSASEDQPTGSPPILDTQGAVKRFANDRGNYMALLNEFAFSLFNKYEELLNDYKANDWQNLSNHAHNLKGLSANFGAMELSRKARELDEFINGNRYDQVKQKLDEINASIENLRAEALAFIGKFSNG